MKLFSKNRKSTNALDEVLYKMPGTNSAISLADSMEGTLITGATGSGKSSGPGRHIAHAMLKHGYGMCILCGKKDEKKRWLKYIQEAAPHRMQDVVIFDKSSGLSFNFLRYDMEREGEGAGDILNAVESLMLLNEQNRVYLSGGGGGKDERFWDLALRRFLSKGIETLRHAGEEISISNLWRLASSCFKGDEPEEYKRLLNRTSDKKNDFAIRQQAQQQLDEWIDSNYFLQTLLKISNESYSGTVEEEIEMIMKYWVREFPKVGEKTSSIILESFMGIVDPFLNKGILKDQFTSGLSHELLPESIYQEGKIVIVDFPIKEFKMAGLYAATIYKTTFQAAMERRDIDTETNPLPVGLWIDEYQLFCSHKTDSQFQSTARSSLVATVYITQNINSIQYVMGNEQGDAKTKSLLGNLNLKFFASNDNYDTNIWASNMIGKHLIDFENLSINHKNEISKSKNQQMYFQVTPEHFTVLKTGRKENDNIVETIVFKAGKVWGQEKQNFALVRFNQN